MKIMDRDALALEYKRYYGNVLGQAKLSDFVNYPPLASELSRLGLGFSEQTLRLVQPDTRPFGDDASNSFLILGESVEHLS